MKVSGLFLMLITAFFLCLRGAGVAHQQTYRDEIDSLLKSLCPVEVNEPGTIVINGPSEEAQQRVRRRLFEIAIDSSESRLQVVEALIKVLEDRSSREGMIAYRWTIAVNLLGDLRATEAIDILVKSVNQTGENGFVSSIHYRPVSRALTRIGEPAIPQLIKALSDDDSIRLYAASALAEIGHPALPKLEEALLNGDAETKGGAAWALTWIGGEEAKTALERAVAAETNEEALSKMKEALKQMHMRW